MLCGIGWVGGGIEEEERREEERIGGGAGWGFEHLGIEGLAVVIC